MNFNFLTLKRWRLAIFLPLIFFTFSPDALAQRCSGFFITCPLGEKKVELPMAWNGVQCNRVGPPLKEIIKRECLALKHPDHSSIEWWYNQAVQAPQDYGRGACSSGVGPLLSVFFNEACVIHDMCYNSKNSKATCDRNFYNDLQSICSIVGVFSTVARSTCIVTTSGMLAAMSTNQAQKAFQKGQDRRERMFGRLVDNNMGASTARKGSWKETKNGEVITGNNYLYSNQSSGEASFTWVLEPKNSGQFEVFVRIPKTSRSSSSPRVRYKAEFDGAYIEEDFDQRNGPFGKWLSLGTGNFVANQQYKVTVSGNSKNILADAVRFHPVNR